MKKKTANGFKKKCISAGVGILIAASAGPSLTAPVYAAQAASEIPEDAAAPTVSDKHSPITQNPDWTAGGYTEFGVKEISNQERRVVIKVILKAGDTGLPLSGRTFRFETWNASTGQTGEVIYPYDESVNRPNDIAANANGELIFWLKPGQSYKLFVDHVDGYIDYVSEVFTFNADGTIEIVLQKKSSNNNGGHTSGGGGNGGGSGNKGNGGNDQNNGPGVDKPNQDNNQTNPSENPNKPGQTNPSNPSGPQNPNDATTPTTPGTEKNEDYVLPGKDLEPGTKDDVTVKPGKDESGNNNSSIDKDGKVDLPDGGTIIRPTEPENGDIRIEVPGGTVVNPDGTIRLPDKNQETTITIPGKDKTLDTPDDVKVTPGLDENGKNNSSIDEAGNITLPDGGRVDYPSIPDQGQIKVDVPEGTVIGPDGTLTIPDGIWNRYTLPGKDSEIDTSDDVQVVPQLGKNGRDNALLREDGSLYLPDGGTVTYADGTEVDVPDGTIVLPDGTILYPDGTTSDGAAEETAAPAENGRIRFADCYFHWLELLALLSMILIAMKRLYHVKRMNEELDQLLGEGEDLSGKDKEE